jgi:hypothetical protein
MKNYLHNSGPGVVIGFPTLGRPVTIEWAFALKSMNTPTNYNTIFHLVKGKPVDVARNEMAALAIEKDAKYLFFVGDDVVIPNHTLKQFIYRMEQDSTIGVIGGVYCTKAIPSEPLVYRGNGKGCYWDWKVGEFFECTGLGMDCTIIRTELLRKLESNWFKTVEEDKYQDAENAAESWTEDLFFCHRVLTETDYKIYCDGSVLCEHWDVNTGTYYKLPTTSLPMRQKAVLKDKRLLLIGPRCTIDREEEFDITTFGKEEADYRGQEFCLPFDNDQFDWVIDTQPSFSYPAEEYARVTKSGGKITVKYHEMIDTEKLAKLFNGHVVGEFVEAPVY